MTQVDAIFQNGVFKPLQKVGLPESQRVRLSVQPLEPSDMRSWLAEVQELRASLLAQRGCFPDSALGIAEDRRR